MSSNTPIHVAHLIHRFDFGGLENGVVNLVNHLPRDRYRHSIIALTQATEIQQRIENDRVEVFALDKSPGKDVASYLRLLKLLRELQPDILHNRNIGTLDAQLIGRLAKIPHRIHSEHGRDTADPDGKNKAMQRRRRMLSPLVEKWVCVSSELASWCVNEVGIESEKVMQICNGVDTDHFTRTDLTPSDTLTFGTVTRFSEIKDPYNTLSAFARVAQRSMQSQANVRLLMVGDGPMLEGTKTLAQKLGVSDVVEFTGSQTDTLRAYHKFDVFVLGSKREGISNTILEAMACGLPVVATRTGGTPELVVEGGNGLLVKPESSEDLAGAMLRLVHQPDLIQRMGESSRQRAEHEFSITGMCHRYHQLYSEVAASSPK